MCGRFTLRRPGEEIAAHFGLELAPSLAPRFNISPGQAVGVVRQASELPARVFEERLWGLVPAWAKDPRIGHRLINARGETAAEKPSFRSAFRRHRCLVPADGFYEWKGASGAKQPYFIQLGDGALFAIAGLWEHWTGPAGEGIESCTLLTTDASDAIRPVHHRMPVILDPADYAQWLDPGFTDAEAVQPLVRPLSRDDIAIHPVSPRVNRPQFDDPACIAPVDDSTEPTLSF